jgi:ribosomal protein L11 methyltransferase
MNYIELKCQINPAAEFQDLVIAALSEIGYEGFVEEETYLLAYIPEELYSEELLASLSIWEIDRLFCTFTPSKILPQNWNALWEKSYEPVIVSDRCAIRADFHPPFSNVEYEILINPKMSFGTAHHETTQLMISMLLKINLQGLDVLDMGTGTGILAILAAKKKAASVVAIDNDVWAVNNASENILLNKTNEIKVLQGDALLLKDMHFDLIIANINRNILLNDMDAYKTVLKEGGSVLLSGFYSKDLEAIKSKAESLKLVITDFVEKNNWVAAAFMHRD